MSRTLMSKWRATINDSGADYITDGNESHTVFVSSSDEALKHLLATLNATEEEWNAENDRLRIRISDLEAEIRKLIDE